MRGRNQNTGDRMTVNQKCLGDTITKTLELMEKCCGPEAYLSIKKCVPTYESCLFN